MVSRAAISKAMHLLFMIGCIYKLTSPSGRIYIGQTTDLLRRFREYTNKKCKSQVKLYHSLSKYGFNNHNFDVIDYCHVDILNDRERFYQEYFNATGKMGLNLKLTHTATRSGKLSKEVRERISTSNVGKHNHDDRVRKLISEAHKGKTISEAHKKIVSDNFKKRHKGEGNPFFGKTHSPDIRKAISERNLGINNVRSKIILDLINGIYYTLGEFSVRVGISTPTAIKRLKSGYFKDYILLSL